MDSLGFVILNYNTWQQTIECVDSILETYQGSKKIFVIDNVSTDDSYKKLNTVFTNDKYREVQCILSDKNGGYAYGNNIGIRACREEGIKYAVIANSDVVFFEGTIKVLYEDIKTNPNAVQIAPTVLNADGNIITPPWKRRQSLIQFVGLKSASTLIYTPKELKELHRVYMVSGCCYVINVDKFINMGAIDDGTFLYMEEGTISMSALKYNYDVMYEPNVSVLHNHGQATGRQNLRIDCEMIKSGLYYWRKYEMANAGELIFVWFVLYVKSIIKIILGKESAIGFVDFSRECFRKLCDEIKMR